MLNIRGPTSSSLLFGITRELTRSKDPTLLYSTWAKEYGSVYRVPTALGTQAVMVYACPNGTKIKRNLYDFPQLVVGIF